MTSFFIVLCVTCLLYALCGCSSFEPEVDSSRGNGVRVRRDLSSKLGMVAARVRRVKLIERKLEKQRPCMQSVYVTVGQSSKISCYPNKNQKLLMRELVDKFRYVDENVAKHHESLKLKYDWKMHDGIAPARAWVDKHYNFNIYNVTTEDSGRIECHASIVTTNKDKPRQLKSIVFRKVLLAKVYPKFSSGAVLSFPMSEDCNQESSKVSFLPTPTHSIVLDYMLAIRLCCF